MRGETITLITRTPDGVDEGNDPIWRTHEETIEDVLIEDGTQANATDSTRPYGASIDRTIHLPRTWPYKSLRGATVRIDGIEYTVLGDPRPYTGGLTPTRWNLTADLHDERG